jgi:hypothetical protein
VQTLIVLKALNDFESSNYFEVNNMRKVLMAVIFISVLGGCVAWRSEQGVDNLWRNESFPAIQKGVTTQTEIIDLLGPPSQIINLEDQVTFYYLREEKHGKGVILILFNYTNVDIKYDRAIFFFDKKGILTDYSLSKETISSKEKK